LIWVLNQVRESFETSVSIAFTALHARVFQLVFTVHTKDPAFRFCQVGLDRYLLAKQLQIFRLKNAALSQDFSYLLLFQFFQNESYLNALKIFVLARFWLF